MMRYYVVSLLSLLLTIACQQPKKETRKPLDTVKTVTASTTPLTQSTGAEPSPVNVVQDLYRVHDDQKSPFFQQKDRTLLDRYFSKELADLIWQDAQNSAKTGEVGLLDGDPLYNAQDMEIKNFRIFPATMLGNKAEVRVGFANFGEKKEFTFLMDKTASGWRIGDILYGDGSQLFQLLSGHAEETP